MTTATKNEIAPLAQFNWRECAGRFLLSHGFVMQSPPVPIGEVQDYLESFGREMLSAIVQEKEHFKKLAQDLINVTPHPGFALPTMPERSQPEALGGGPVSAPESESRSTRSNAAAARVDAREWIKQQNLNPDCLGSEGQLAKLLEAYAASVSQEPK